MPSAAELVVPVRAALIPIPGVPQRGICSICHSGCNPDFSVCYPCHAAQHLDPPEILPITLSVEGGLIHRHLRLYKDGRDPDRTRMILRLAALLSIFVANHGGCIGDYDYCTVVPSARRAALGPVVERVRSLAGSYRQVLSGRPEATERTLDPDQFLVTADIEGDRILLLDDTFTSGAKLFSAVAALRRAGAEAVGPVVIGRHVAPRWPPSADLLNWITERRWDESTCARCGGERSSASLF